MCRQLLGSIIAYLFAWRTVRFIVLSTKTYPREFKKCLSTLAGIFILASCAQGAGEPDEGSTPDEEVTSSTVVTTIGSSEVARLLAEPLKNIQITGTVVRDPAQENTDITDKAVITLTFDGNGNSETKLLSLDPILGMEYMLILSIDGTVYTQVAESVPGGTKTLPWVTTAGNTDVTKSGMDPLVFLTGMDISSQTCAKTASYLEIEPDTWEVVCPPVTETPLVIGLKDERIEYIQYASLKFSYEPMENVETFTAPKDILEGDKATLALISRSMSGATGHIGALIVSLASEKADSVDGAVTVSDQNLTDAAKELLTSSNDPKNPSALDDLYPDGGVKATYDQKVLTLINEKYNITCRLMVTILDGVPSTTAPECAG